MSKASECTAVRRAHGFRAGFQEEVAFELALMGQAELWPRTARAEGGA